MNVTHYVDFIRFIAGIEVESVTAVARPAAAEIEEAMSINMRFDGDAIGTIAASASTRGTPSSRFELWGEHGTIRLEPEAAAYSERAIGGMPAGRWCELPAAGVDARILFLEEFAAAVAAGEPAPVGALDGLAVQAFVEAAYSSVGEGATVAVDRRAAVEAA